MTRAARRIRRSRPFAGRVFHVDRDLVVLPNGRATTMDVVRHRGSVVIVPQPARDRVVLIRQYRYAIRQWIWELPAGSLEPGEAPARAARRECAEEIGLLPARVRRLGMFYPTPGFCDERMIFYRCEGLAVPPRPVARDEDEDIRPRDMTLEAAWRLVRRGHIVDLKTVVGLWLVGR
jgi:ADP-ribose pyrophosphatase